MKPPDNTLLFETPISTHWFDENGIFCAVSKKVDRTVEHYQKVMELYSNFTKDGNKLCLLSYAHNTMPMSNEVRNFVSTEMPKHIKAHAIVLEQPLEKSLINLFIKLSFSGFPVCQFSEEKVAKEWLLDYL